MIFNKLLRRGGFSSTFKLTCVTAIFKKRREEENQRLLSLTLAVGKPLEFIVRDKIVKSSTMKSTT